MSNQVLGAQLYTLRGAMTDKEKISDGLKHVREIGYESVQLSGIPVPFEDNEWFKSECDKNSLAIVATHDSIISMLADTSRIVEKHKILGCSHVGIGAPPYDMWSKPDQFPQYINDCAELSSRLKPHGLTLFHHNHKFEFQVIEDKTLLEHLRDGAPDIEFMLDYFWVQSGGKNPVDLTYDFKGRISQVHFKDLKVVCDEVKYAEIGYGNLDFKKIYKACCDIGVRDILVEQDECYGDPYEALEKSCRYIRTHLF